MIRIWIGETGQTLEQKEYIGELWIFWGCTLKLKFCLTLERSKVFHRKNHLRLQLQWIKWNLKMTTKFQITRNNSNHNEIYYVIIYEIKLNALWFNKIDYDGNLLIVRWRKAIIKKKSRIVENFLKQRDPYSWVW